MKRLSVCLVVFMSVLVLSVPASALDGRASLGKLFNSNYPTNPGYSSKALHELEVEVGHKIDIWEQVSMRPYARHTILMDEDNDAGSLHPSGAKFFVGNRITLTDNIFAEYEHLCWHPIDTEGEVYSYDKATLGFEWGKTRKPGWDGNVLLSKYSDSNYPANPDYTASAKLETEIEVGRTMNIWKNLKVRPYLRHVVLLDERVDIHTGHPAGIKIFAGSKLWLTDSLFMEYEHLCWHPVDTGGEVYSYDLLKLGFEWGKS